MVIKFPELVQQPEEQSNSRQRTYYREGSGAAGEEDH
jgi:hypothetical protein